MPGQLCQSSKAISCTARPQTLLAGMPERLSIRRYMTQLGFLRQPYFCRPCTHCALPCRPQALARDSNKHPRSRQIRRSATAQPGIGEDSAHLDEYFGQMGRRGRKTRKREMHNLPGRGFPHKAEDAHEAVFLALAQTTSVMALALGSILTIYKPGYAHNPCRSSLCLVTEFPQHAAVIKAPMLCSPPAVMWDLTMQHAPPSPCTPSLSCACCIACEPPQCNQQRCAGLPRASRSAWHLRCQAPATSLPPSAPWPLMPRGPCWLRVAATRLCGSGACLTCS